MNDHQHPGPDPSLQRDLFADSAADLRRRIRRRQHRLASIGTLGIVAALAFLALQTDPQPAPSIVGPSPTVAPDTPLPIPAPAPAPPASDNPAAPYETLTTDQELLAALADQGPMLITHADGRKQLILTRAR